MSTKQGREIAAGDTIIDYRGEHTVKRILEPCCTGSWQECAGTGFPCVEYTDGTTDMLVPWSYYEIAEQKGKVGA